MPPASPPADARQPRWSRRGLLRLAAAAGAVLPFAALVGSGRKQDDSPVGAHAGMTGTPPATSTTGPTTTPTATAAPSPIALTLDLLPATLGIGEAMRVRVPLPAWATDAVGTLRFAGSEHQLTRLPDGALWGVVAAALDASPVASLPLAVQVTTATGAPVGAGEVQTAIVPVPRPVEYLYVTEEQGAVLGGDAGPREAAIRQAQFAAFDPVPPRWNGLFQRPTPGVISTDFGGARSINDGPPGPGHTGTDFADAEGTPVRLAAPGRVVWAGAMPIRGNAVLVDHGAGVKSGYHHLGAIHVQVGDTVLPAGAILGTVGATGFATGPHLHWEVTVRGVNVDGMTWLTTPFAA